MFFLRHRKEVLSLTALAAVFFGFYLFLSLDSSILPVKKGEPLFLILNQPDETVNYFFIRQLVLNSRFNYPESLSEITGNQIHPRSTTVVDGAVVPIGFPGMIALYGFLLKILILPLGHGFFNILAVSLTPLLAVLAPFFFYGFLRRIFSGEVAWLSAVFLFFMPAWWYYASRPFQHNTLFVFLIILWLYSFVKIVIPSEAPDKSGAESRYLLNSRLIRNSSAPPALFQKERDSVGMTFIVGLLFGLAVFVRPAEIVWLAALGLILLIAARRHWSGRDYLGISAGLILSAILFFAAQTAFYGNPLASGYVRPQADGGGGLILAGPQDIPFFKALLLPFGFHQWIILKNIKNYFFDLFGVWTMTAVLGGFALIWRYVHDIANPRRVGGEAILMVEEKRLLCRFAPRKIVYILFLSLVSCYLLIFYGSWLFYDNLVKIPSIGTSYVRYFLPIYVFSLPLVSWAVVWLWRRSRILKMAAAVLAAVLFLSGVREVFAPLEGLASVKETVRQYAVWQAEVYRLTEPNAVIVTRYGDKYLFPGRKIIAGFENEEQMRAIGNLVRADYPVYLYDLKLDEKTEKELAGRLSSAGVKLSAPAAGWEDLELRKVMRY